MKITPELDDLIVRMLYSEVRAILTLMYPSSKGLGNDSTYMNYTRKWIRNEKPDWIWKTGRREMEVHTVFSEDQQNLYKIWALRKEFEYIKRLGTSPYHPLTTWAERNIYDVFHDCCWCGEGIAEFKDDRMDDILLFKLSI